MSKYSVYGELPFDEAEAPKTTEYECDVLVVGGGYAGLCAAVKARKAGMSVVLVDKGRPGYSGQSPHVCCTRWFDADLGDERATVEKLYYHDAEYLELCIRDSQKQCEQVGAKLYLPPMGLCGDNGAMIACQGYYELLAGNVAGQELNAVASLSPEKGSYRGK